MVGEELFTGIFVEFNRTGKFSIYVEPRMAAYSEAPIIEDSEKVNLFGAGLGMFYGNKVQLGMRCMVGFYDKNESINYLIPEKIVMHKVFTSSLLVIRITMKDYRD